MRDGLKEPIGFLCRWALLSLGVAIMAAAAWAGTLAAHEVASDVGAVMVVPDAVITAWSQWAWRGWIDPPAPGGSASAALSYRPGGPAMFVHTHGKWIYPRLDRVHAGPNRVTIKGTPYGAFAYQRGEAMLCIISAETDVFLLDARMAAAVADFDQFRGCLEELAGRGQPVFFHAGPMRKFVEIHRRLRNLESSTPVTWEIMRVPEVFGAVKQFAGRLRRLRPGGPKPFLVTADVELARWAGKNGFFTYLIAPPPAEALSGRILRLESPAKFKEYLAAQPISR